MKIPVFHDDQHGTAIISGAALINALEIAAS
jgi:malate dehydrogenase (oxaloacetate-decarboxylating)(NADP+)